MIGHPIQTVTGFEKLDTYVLRVEFEDRTSQVIDFEPVLHGKIFEPLKDPEYFAQVYLNEEIDTIAWPNGPDFEPYTLYEWPRFAEQMAARAAAWDRVPARDD